MIFEPEGIDKSQEKVGLKEIISDISDEFTKEALSLIYPSKIVKRVLFRPFVGKLFPYIDIKTPTNQTQLSFFYGRISVRFSSERKCCVCEKQLNTQDKKILNKSYIPLYICQECKRNIFYGYWECLKSTLINASHFNSNNIGVDSPQRCNNFLEPRCGYPLDSDRINPCLLNHGIGLLLKDNQTFTIYAAPLEKLKYMMAWDGGIAGIILGYSRRIMNLEQLERLFSNVVKSANQVIQKLNESIDNKNQIIKITVPQIQMRQNPENTLSLREWILFSFLKYYQNYEIQKYCRFLLDRPLFILKKVLEGILQDLDIEILEFLKLYEWYPPLDFKFREWLEGNFKHLLNLENLKSFKCEIMDKLCQTPLYSQAHVQENSQGFKSDFNYYLTSNSNSVSNSISNSVNNHLYKYENDVGSNFSTGSFKTFLDQFCPLESIKFSALQEDLEIYEILGAFGNNLIVNSNKSNQPCLVDLNNLSGRYIY